MNRLIEALNHPAEAYKKENKVLSWGLVLLTILLSSVFDPVVQHIAHTGTHEYNILQMLRITGYGMLSYLLLCFAFWIVCKVFGSNVSFSAHITCWGITYIPNIICAVVVSLTEVYFYIFWNSTVWGMLLSIVFVGILLWKVILYLIYLREFAGLRGGRLLGTFVVMCVIILVMAALNGYVGLKTPVL